MENLSKDITIHILEIHGYAREMRDFMSDIRDVLLTMHEQQQPAYPPLAERKRWNKRQVKDMLNMSESTYKRNLKVELLVPMRLSGDDEYFEEDLIRAMEESRRRGRL